ncbi:Monoacylglycerol lipase ABHD12 [Penicillium expansum]|nr:Monoacylglycerol lipase ABHD12 [Penicillium expansum]
MAMQYLNQIKNLRRSSQMTSAPKPVLTAEDEAYLREVTAQPESVPITTEQNEQATAESPAGAPLQPAISEQAENIPLPISPGEELAKELGEEGRQETEELSSNIDKISDTKVGSLKASTEEETDKDTPDANKSQTEPTTRPATSDTSTNGKDADKDKDAEDMTDILERLNLAADNNRVFSISEETQELLRKFKLIFKDLINGVPTAYHDLEMLLTNGNRQLQETYTKLPGPMQKLIEKLPERWTETLAPEMLAVAADRASKSGVNMENVGKAAAAAEKMGVNIPSLKELVSKPAALSSCLSCGTATSVEGKSVLENERLVTEEEITKLNQDTSEGLIRPTETLTTTAPPGATPDEIREGVRKVEEARAAPVESAVPAEVESESQQSTQQSTRPAVVPTRSKSQDTLCLIAESLDHQRDRHSLVLSCRRLYTVLLPTLYSQVILGDVSNHTVGQVSRFFNAIARRPELASAVRALRLESWDTEDDNGDIDCEFEYDGELIRGLVAGKSAYATPYGTEYVEKMFLKAAKENVTTFPRLTEAFAEWYDTENSIPASCMEPFFKFPAMRRIGGSYIVDSDREGGEPRITPFSGVTDIDLDMTNTECGFGVWIESCKALKTFRLNVGGEMISEGPDLVSAPLRESISLHKSSLEAFWLCGESYEPPEDDDGWMGSFADFDTMKYLHISLSMLAKLNDDFEPTQEIVSLLPPSLETLYLCHCHNELLEWAVDQIGRLLDSNCLPRLTSLGLEGYGPSEVHQSSLETMRKLEELHKRCADAGVFFATSIGSHRVIPSHFVSLWPCS